MSKKRRRELAELCGQNLLKARRAAGLTQTDLAKTWRVAQSYIARIENGHIVPSLLTLDRAARSLGVKLTDLVQESKTK